ncbi:LysE family translocator [Paracoccus spongiarum]|uniref:LysE family translocator n=1 Tax=Paracoccus spongiarum TaxID=3064387 RepID=A0ABT9JDY3_9RHOB|nr:LysE family translocator [Paracoccus sp. 2205BS29-5]MDP5307925.1 LysE family translocator [Paracoccus sp. 2205BS29-5]
MDLIATIFGDLQPSLLGSFVLASVLMEITPGPNMAYLAILALSDGRGAGYAAVAGVATGLLVVGLTAALGVGAAVSASPLAYQTLRWGGVLYLLWLAWEGWRDADEASEHAAQGSSLGRFFGRGLITNLLNPKAFAFYIAVLPGFLALDRPVVPQAIGLSLLFVAIATTIHLGIVTLASASRRLLSDQRRRRAMRRVLSVLLAFVALWLAVRTAA